MEIKFAGEGSCCCSTAKMNPTSIYEDAGSIPGPARWVEDLVSCGVGHRCSSDPSLLWLWCRLAAVVQFKPQPGNFHMPRMRPQNRRKKKKLQVRRSLGLNEMTCVQHLTPTRCPTNSSAKNATCLPHSEPLRCPHSPGTMPDRL